MPGLPSSGDLHPDFLPPGPAVPHAEWAGERPREPLGRAVGLLTGAAITAGLFLMVSAFLPWVNGKLVLGGLGHVLERDLGTEPGVNVDGTGQLMPVLALIAIVMCLWGIVGRNPWISTLAAAPGLLAVACCAFFLLRLDRAEDRLVGAQDGLAYEITLGYGWFLSLASSLLIIGAVLALPMIIRMDQS